MKWFTVFLVSLAATAASAQSDFHVVSGSEVLLEGGRVDKLTVVSGNYQFNIRPPRGWYREVNESGREIIFTSPSSKSAMTVQFTTNFPGVLPEQDTLRTRVLGEHPGASILQSTVCPTGYRPGVLFDLVRVPAPQVVQKIRHAFVAEPLGSVECSLAASDDEFEGNKTLFMGLMRAFRVDKVDRQ